MIATPNFDSFYFLLICSPVLLLSPLVFLVRKVRKRSVLCVAALAIVFGSYGILLFAVVPPLLAGWIMFVADNPANNFHEVVLKEDQTLAGVRFPKGSKLTAWKSDGKPTSIVLSKDTDINGIPAGKGTTVLFPPSSWAITTGRAWTYRGISVPAGSTIYLGTSGIWQIMLSGTTEVQGIPSSGAVCFGLQSHPVEDYSWASLRIKPTEDTIVDGIPVAGTRNKPYSEVIFSSDQRMMECVLARPFDRDGYKLAEGWRIRVLYEKGINGERQDKVVKGTLREDCVLNGVTWPAGVSFEKLAGDGVQYEVPGMVGVVVQLDDMLIRGPSTVVLEGDKLKSVVGPYVWHGDQYKSYRVGADGQIQREPE